MGLRLSPSFLDRVDPQQQHREALASDDPTVVAGLLSPRERELASWLSENPRDPKLGADILQVMRLLHISQPQLRGYSGHPHILMTPPRPDYGRYHDGHNAWESTTKGQDRNPRKALEEWLRVATLIGQLGGYVYVKPPVPESAMGVSDGVFTANDGYMFPIAPNELLFLGARMIFPIRGGEAQHSQIFWQEVAADMAKQNRAAKLAFALPEAVWEGQADVSRELPGGKIILTEAVRTKGTGNKEIKKYFSPEQKTLRLTLKDPFFHGDTAINVVRNKEGKPFVIYCPDAFTPKSVAELKLFTRGIPLIPISYEDAEKAYVANSLEINGTLLLMGTASAELKLTLLRNKIDFIDLHMSELFVKGGGGTRCCSLELRIDPSQHTHFFAALQRYLFNPRTFDELLAHYPLSIWAQRARSALRRYAKDSIVPELSLPPIVQDLARRVVALKAAGQQILLSLGIQLDKDSQLLVRNLVERGYLHDSLFEPKSIENNGANSNKTLVPNTGLLLNVIQQRRGASLSITESNIVADGHQFLRDLHANIGAIELTSAANPSLLQGLPPLFGFASAGATLPVFTVRAF